MAGRRGVFPLLMRRGGLRGVDLMYVRNRGWRGSRFKRLRRRIVLLLLLNVVDQGVEIGGSEGTDVAEAFQGHGSVLQFCR